jgi:predicted DCC family thiol-disulfide oxidoreductase YuxK
MTQINHKTILLFDAKCKLCNSSIAFILKYKKNNTIKFCSVQSDIGKEITKDIFKNHPVPTSLIFINKSKVYTKSSAVLQICKFLKGLFPVLFCFIIIPNFIRNPIYDWISKNRYKWFGKQNECVIINSEL